MKKPNPGMVLDAAKQFKLSLSQSFFLGDTDRDTGVAENSGCQSILWERAYNQSVKADYRVNSLAEVYSILQKALLKNP